jgi:hypothetical protein
MLANHFSQTIVHAHLQIVICLRMIEFLASLLDINSLIQDKEHDEVQFAQKD